MHPNLDSRNPLDSLVWLWKNPDSLWPCLACRKSWRETGDHLHCACTQNKLQVSISWYSNQHIQSENLPRTVTSTASRYICSGIKSSPPNLISPELHHTLQLAGRALSFASLVFGSYCSAPSWKVSESSCSAWPWPQLHHQFSQWVPLSPAPSPCPDCPSEHMCCRAGANEFFPTWGLSHRGTLQSQLLLYPGADWIPSLRAHFYNKTRMVQISPVKYSAFHKG